jgi:hypothetical protein
MALFFTKRIADAKGNLPWLAPLGVEGATAVLAAGKRTRPPYVSILSSRAWPLAWP